MTRMGSTSNASPRISEDVSTRKETRLFDDPSHEAHFEGSFSEDMMSKERRTARKNTSNKVRRARGASTETYLNLHLRNVLGLGQWLALEFQGAANGDAYQIADNDLALSACRGTLGRGGLRSSTAGSAGLLDTSDGSSGCCRARGRATLRVASTASGSAALGRDDLVERLVELSRHDYW